MNVYIGRGGIRLVEVFIQRLCDHYVIVAGIYLERDDTFYGYWYGVMVETFGYCEYFGRLIIFIISDGLYRRPPGEDSGGVGATVHSPIASCSSRRRRIRKSEFKRTEFPEQSISQYPSSSSP